MFEIYSVPGIDQFHIPWAILAICMIFTNSINIICMFLVATDLKFHCTIVNNIETGVTKRDLPCTYDFINLEDHNLVIKTYIRSWNFLQLPSMLMLPADQISGQYRYPISSYELSKLVNWMCHHHVCGNFLYANPVTYLHTNWWRI